MLDLKGMTSNVTVQSDSFCSKQNSLDTIQENSSSWNIMFFINPTSGKNAALALLKPGVTSMHLQCSIRVHLWFFDIRNNSSAAHPGFKKLKSITENLKQSTPEQCCRGESSQAQRENLHKKVLVIAVGGDGTVMYLVSQIFSHNIDSNYVAFGVLPYGTGNDFAKAFGWNHHTSINLFTPNLQRLHHVIEEWIAARVVWHDIWDVVITTDSGGSFQKIDSTTRQKYYVDKDFYNQHSDFFSRQANFRNDHHESQLCLKMCNYFSIGIESRIGIGFERHRTKCAVLNKLCYATEGLKKMVLKKKFFISTIVDAAFEQRNDSKFITIFSNTKESKQELRRAASLIATNLPSFAAGLNIWDPSHRWGLKSPPEPKCMGAKQKIGDGLLELMTFGGILDLGVERIIRGRGKRIYQGPGPFILEFHSQSESNGKKPQRVYFQVDGEFFITTSIKQAYIKLWKKISVITPHPLNHTSFCSISETR